MKESSPKNLLRLSALPSQTRLLVNRRTLPLLFPRFTTLRVRSETSPPKNLKTRKYIINFSVAFFCLLFFRERKVRRVSPTNQNLKVLLCNYYSRTLSVKSMRSLFATIQCRSIFAPILLKAMSICREVAMSVSDGTAIPDG